MSRHDWRDTFKPSGRRSDTLPHSLLQNVRTQESRAGPPAGFSVHRRQATSVTGTEGFAVYLRILQATRFKTTKKGQLITRTVYSRRRLAQRCLVSERTITRILTRLLDMNLIQVDGKEVPGVVSHRYFLPSPRQWVVNWNGANPEKLIPKLLAARAKRLAKAG